MKKEINVFDYAEEILKKLDKGVLLNSSADGKFNSMTISWGALGIEWGKKIFTVYVRENRCTKEQLEKNPEFTISMPMGEIDKRILSVCGTKSGYEMDKVKELGLELEAPNIVSVSGIKQLPLTLECKIIYKQEQDKMSISEDDKAKFYPQDVESSFHGANKDFHTMYYGEIVSAYIIE